MATLVLKRAHWIFDHQYSEQGIASDTIHSHYTILYTDLIAGYILIKGIVLRLFHIKMWPSGEVAPKFDLPPIELN